MMIARRRATEFPLLMAALLGVVPCLAARGQSARPPTDLYRMQAASTEVKWSSFVIDADGRREIPELRGAGVITRFWATYQPFPDPAVNDAIGRALVVNIYWDGGTTPAVSAPLADFFCQPLRLQAIENEFFSSTNDLCVFDCRIPMPFRESARVELVNGSDRKLDFFYLLHVDRRPVEEDALYLHAHWRRQMNVGREDEVVVLPEVEGRGRYLGTHWAVHQERPGRTWDWYNRRCRIFTDTQAAGDAPLLAIGSIDDYLLSGWWSRERSREPYARRHAGRPYLRQEGERLSIALYRYHVADAIWFHRNVSFRLDGIRSDIGRSDWSSTALFYLDRPENGLPPIQDARQRTTGFNGAAATP